MSSHDDINKRKRKFKTLYDGGHLIGCSAVSERLIALHKRLGSADSLSYADDLYNYAIVNLELGLYGLSSKLFDEALEFYREHKLRRKEYDCLLSLGIVHTRLGSEEEATLCFDDALTLAFEYISEDDAIDARYNKAGMLSIFGKTSEATALYETLTEITHDKLLLADIYSNLGYCYEKNKDNDLAVRVFKKALALYKSISGEYSEDYLAMVYYLAQFHAYTKAYEASIKYYTEAAKIIRRTFSDKGAYYTDTINRMADMYSMIGNLDRSLFFRLKALKLMKTQIGEDHIYYANNLKNAALIYREKGDMTKAEEYLLLSVNIKGRILGDSNPDRVRDVFQLCSMYLEQNDYENAVSMLKKTAASLDKQGGAMSDIAGEITSVCKHISGTGEKSTKELEALERLRSIEKKMLSDAEMWF